jgi:phenylacetate-CoA ligase
VTPGFSLALGPAFREELALLQETQWMEEGALRALQRARLLRVLAEAHGGPGGGDPERLLTTSPVPQRDEVARGGRPGLLARRTSGTSGTSLVVPVGRRAYAQMLAGFWRSLGWWGVSPGERGLVLLGSSAPAVVRAGLLGKDALLGAHRVFVQDGRPWPARARTLLGRTRYAYVYGYPSALYELALGSPPLETSPRVVVVTGEPLFGFQRRAIERWAGAPVAEEYGCTELGSVAVQCPRGRLHLVAEQVWLEGGSPPRATSLLLRPRPLVRYPLPEAVEERPGPCACGRSLPVVELGEWGSAPWRAVEAATESVQPPARFRVVASSRWRLHVARAADPTQADSLLRSLRALREDVTLVWEDSLPRGPAGKFRYLVIP